MFWLIGTAFALRNFLSPTTLWSFTRVFRENRDLLVFGGACALTEILGPNQQKPYPKKIKKHVENYIFVAVSKKYVFVKNTAICFRTQPLVHPLGAVRTEKT